jgi:hypothetical protein
MIMFKVKFELKESVLNIGLCVKILKLEKKIYKIAKKETKRAMNKA